MNIEDHIRKAIEEGKFENLPGKGKPLHLEENPFEDPEWRTAYKILKDGGFSLPWIELRQEIEAELSGARKELQTAWKNRRDIPTGRSDTQEADREWQRAVSRFEEKAAAINKKIFSYNIQAPAASLQMPAIEPARELARIQSGE